MTILRKIIMNCRSNWIIQMKSSHSLHIYGDGRNIPKIAVKWAHFGILWIMWNKSWPFLEWKWHKKRISLDKNGVWKFCKESLCIVQILVKSWGSENGKKNPLKWRKSIVFYWKFVDLCAYLNKLQMIFEWETSQHPPSYFFWWHRISFFIK